MRLLQVLQGMPAKGLAPKLQHVIQVSPQRSRVSHAVVAGLRHALGS